MFLTDLEDVDLLDWTKSLPWYSKILYLAYSNNFSTSAISINYRKKKKTKPTKNQQAFEHKMQQKLAEKRRSQIPFCSSMWNFCIMKMYMKILY